MAIREPEREDNSAVVRKLIDVPGYTYRLFVPSRDDDPVELWRDSFLSMLLVFNPLSLYQQAIGTRSEKHYQRPSTLRSSAFLGGAIPGNRALPSALHCPKLGWG